MFKCKYNFKIEERESVAFVRLLGRFGFQFEMSDVRTSSDCLGWRPVTQYRVFKVYTTPWKMAKFRETINILANYHLG